MRKFLFSCLSLVICFSLCSCHGKTKTLSEFTLPDSFDNSKQYNLSFWSKNDTNITQKRIYEQTISDFEKYYPNIKVELRSYTNYKDIYKDVITNISTNTTPNICIAYPDHIATYLDGDQIVVPLDGLLDHPLYGLGGSELLYEGIKKEDIIEKFLMEGTIGDHLYALPFMRSSEACYINKDYVERLGFTIPDVITYDFMYEVASKAMAEKAEEDVLIPIIYKSTDNMMIQAMKQSGNEISNELGEFVLDNEFSRAFLKEVCLNTFNKNFSTFSISSYPGNYFNAEQCIFAIDSTAGATWMGSNAPLQEIDASLIKDFETVVKPVPQIDIEHPQMISQGPSLCIFNKEDKNEVIASFIFMQYLLTNKVQIAYSQTEGYIPVTHKAINSNEYTDYLSKRGTNNNLYYDVKIDAAKLVIDNIDNTFVTCVFNGSMSLREASGELIESVCKFANRKKRVVEDGDLDEIFNNIYKLKKLDTIGGKNFNITGKMPKESVAFLIILGSVWIVIGVYVSIDYLKKKKNIKVD